MCVRVATIAIPPDNYICNQMTQIQTLFRKSMTMPVYMLHTNSMQTRLTVRWQSNCSKLRLWAQSYFICKPFPICSSTDAKGHFSFSLCMFIVRSLRTSSRAGGGVWGGGEESNTDKALCINLWWLRKEQNKQRVKARPLNSHVGGTVRSEMEMSH
jgi:hypothetical protein